MSLDVIYVSIVSKLWLDTIVSHGSSCVCVSAPEPEAEDIHIIAVVVSQKKLGGVVSQK